MTQLGKYTLHEILGKGGFGTVYRATDTVLNRVVALKVLHPQLALDPDFIERFKREAQVVAALDHPNIVTVHDMGEVDGRFFIVMKYLPGGSLAEKIRQGPLPYAEAARVMQQVCDGLQQAHDRGMVHRDLKPANILFDSDGRAVIGDFGLAKILSSTSSSSSGLGGAGTPFYRAPEVWLGKPPVTPATDVYALGCILYEMLAGKLLFPGESTEQVIAKHLVIGPEFVEGWPPEGVPGAVDAVIRKALAKDPSERYVDAKAFADALIEVNAPNPKRKIFSGPEPSNPDEAQSKPKESSKEAKPKLDASTILKALGRLNRWKFVAIGLACLALISVISFWLPTMGEKDVDGLKPLDPSKIASPQENGAEPSVTPKQPDQEQTAISDVSAQLPLATSTVTAAPLAQITATRVPTATLLPTEILLEAYKNLSLLYETQAQEAVFSPNGKYVVFCETSQEVPDEATIKILDLQSFKILKELKITKVPEYYNCSLIFSPAGNLLGAGDRIYHFPSLDQTSFTGSVRAFSKDGRFLFSEEIDWEIHENSKGYVWDVIEESLLFSISDSWIGTAVFSPDGSKLAVGSYAQNDSYTEVTMWDISTKQPLWKVSKTFGRIQDMAFSYEGRLLSIDYKYAKLFLLEANTGDVYKEFTSGKGQGPANTFSKKQPIAFVRLDTADYLIQILNYGEDRIVCSMQNGGRLITDLDLFSVGNYKTENLFLYELTSCERVTDSLGYAWRFASSDSGKLFYAYQGSSFHLFDVKTWNEVGSLPSGGYLWIANNDNFFLVESEYRDNQPYTYSIWGFQ